MEYMNNVKEELLAILKTDGAATPEPTQKEKAIQSLKQMVRQDMEKEAMAPRVMMKDPEPETRYEYREVYSHQLSQLTPDGWEFVQVVEYDEVYTPATQYDSDGNAVYPPALAYKSPRYLIRKKAGCSVGTEDQAKTLEKIRESLGDEEFNRIVFEEEGKKDE